MNRIISFLLKSIVAFLIILFQLPVFAIDYFSTGDGSFDAPSTWSTSSTGTPVVTKLFFSDGLNNFTIQKGHQVRINSDLGISINNLTITGVTRGPGRLIIASTVSSIEINGTLTLSYGAIIFGTQSVNMIVNGDLKGGQDSGIQQTPGSRQAQILTLKGLTNTLELYQTNATDAFRGTSEIIYSGAAGQKIFASTNYSLLTISDRGEKVLAGDITVSNGLSISGTYVKLGNYSLEYSGLEPRLDVRNGWVYTNGTGAYINSNKSEATKTFPVGNATSMQKIELSGITNLSAEISMRFDPSIISGTLTADGLGAWNINTDLALSFKAKLINPIADSRVIITEKSDIASFSDSGINPVWQVQPTTFSTADASYTSDSPLNINGDDNTWFMLYNCPVYTITPISTIPTAYIGELYSTQFSVTSSNTTTTDINKLINTTALPNKFSFVGGLLKSSGGVLGPAGKPLLTLRYTDDAGCKSIQDYTLVITSLPSPNLSMANIDTKTFGADSFRVRAFSRSTGKITYSITGGCAIINDTSGYVNITCAGPSPNNQVTVTATQLATSAYKAESVSKSFIINPAPGRLYIKNFAFLASGQNSSINAVTKSQPKVISFEQLTGFNEATVSTTGMVVPHQTGQFTVHISLAATNNYTAFDSVYTFNVYTLDKPPIAVADTITLAMGTDSTFNILLNDRGQTSEIIPKNTDVDMENRGRQLKFYSTELGNFTIDTLGNLTVKPFYGFIGSGRLAYTVTDLNGLTSEIAYVDVIVIPPYVVPELKVNTIMTPNGDNLNDALVIANTDLSKENSLIILDQIGNTVYETTNYQNNWEGVDNKNNKLEPGVYFYTFKEKVSGRELSNYIQIVK